MESNNLDFSGLNANLLADARNLLPAWLPGGRFQGNEYCVASVHGGVGDSLKYNIVKGTGSDFAANQTFGDMIDLYSQIHGISQGEAFKRLSGHAPVVTSTLTKEVQPRKPETAFFDNLSGQWTYHNPDGKPIFHVKRFETPKGKQYYPFLINPDGTEVCKGYPPPRPLYNLHIISANPSKPILICEGEKATDAAMELLGQYYVCTTWPNGAQAISKVDWSSIYGRSVLLWPDADRPGVECMDKLANVLRSHVKEIKIINPQGKPDGWDAADALADGYDTSATIMWAKANLTVVNIQAQNVAVVTPQASITVNTNDPDVPAKISESTYAVIDRLGLATSGNGIPLCNYDNLDRVFSGDGTLTKGIWFDEFYKRFFIQDGSIVREWTDADTIDLTVKLQRGYGLTRIEDNKVYKAMAAYAKRRPRNAPRDWLTSLQWDGVDRINRYMSAYLGAEDSAYTRAVSRNWWISLVARIYLPGCQMRHMVVLEGKQETGKSKSLSIVGGPWYLDNTQDLNRNNFFEVLDGKMIVEIGELNAFRRAEMTRIKQVISCQSDYYRAPYDRVPENHPRTCVFVGTTNDTNWIDDDTGATRFWPILTTSIDIEAIIRDRDQLFAEAVHAFKAGEKWHITPMEDTLEQQEARRRTDPWENKIITYLYNKAEITTTELMDDCLKIEPSRQTRFDEMRVGNILKSIGWHRTRKRVSGNRQYVYHNDDLGYSYDDFAK